MLEDGMVRPTVFSVERLGRRRWRVTISLTEGRNREVRRLCTELGLDIERLVRVQFGPVKLGSLASGVTRPLTTRERSMIDALTAQA